MKEQLAYKIGDKVIVNLNSAGYFVGLLKILEIRMRNIYLKMFKNFFLMV